MARSHPRKPGSRPRSACGTPGLLLGLALVGGCSTGADWRSVAVPGTALDAELPCRPGRFERQVRVAGTDLRLFMLSCEAGGVTYGVATAELSDPARVDAVLHGLMDAARAAIGSTGEPPCALDLDGVTPFSGNTQARLRGRRPDGRPVEESIRVFARGTRVFAASAIGQVLPEAALGPFERGLHFDLGGQGVTSAPEDDRRWAAREVCNPATKAARRGRLRPGRFGLFRFPSDNPPLASRQGAGIDSSWLPYC